jgi:hypothetical protein
MFPPTSPALFEAFAGPRVTVGSGCGRQSRAGDFVRIGSAIPQV